MKSILLIVFTGFVNLLFCQTTTIVLKPGANEGKDAEIFNLQPSNNFASNHIRGNAWTFSGNAGIVRGLFQFDLSVIPAVAKIVSAQLDLFAPLPPDAQFNSGDNKTYLQRITTEWDELTVTWNNQPVTTSLHQLSLDSSVDEYQDYRQINVTQLVQDMVDDPDHSFGFMLKQQSETILRRMTFASSDYPDPDKHPALKVIYSLSNCTSLVLQPGDNGKDAEIFSLEPNTNLDGENLRANAWTFGGNTGLERSFIQFDLTQLPVNAIIEWATLSLYALDASSDQFHSGDNETLIRRITSNWNESTVTWNNQPSTTTNNQVLLATSYGSFQDYENIDVTNLVKDMWADPNNSYGFMLKLETESTLRRTGFSSGDHPNAQRHPKLEICYSNSVAVEPVLDEKLITVHPNPFSDWVNFNSIHYPGEYKVLVHDLLGLLYIEIAIQRSGTIDLHALNPGMYVVKLVGSSGQLLGVKSMIKL